MARNAKRWLLAAGFGATLVVLGLASAGHRGSSGPGSLAGTDTSPINRVCNGEPWSLSEALVGMPFQIVLPNHPLANETTLVRVWRCSDIQVAFEYQSGLVVYLEQNSLDDPAAVWARLAQEYPEYSTGTVSRTPASFAQPDASGGSVGGVQFVRDGVDIVVNGNGEIPLSDLIQVSESLSPVVPSPLVTPTLSISTSAN